VVQIVLKNDIVQIAGIFIVKKERKWNYTGAEKAKRLVILYAIAVVNVGA